jgi:hypothetical protein
MKELTTNSSKINSQRTRRPDRRPSETFSVECAGQPTRKRTRGHAKDAAEAIAERGARNRRDLRWRIEQAGKAGAAYSASNLEPLPDSLSAWRDWPPCEVAP